MPVRRFEGKCQKCKKPIVIGKVTFGKPTKVKCPHCGFEYEVNILYAPHGLGENSKPDPERLN